MSWTQRFLDVKVLDEMNSVLSWCHPAVAQAAEQLTFVFFIQPAFKLTHNGDDPPGHPPRHPDDQTINGLD